MTDHIIRYKKTPLRVISKHKPAGFLIFDLFLIIMEQCAFGAFCEDSWGWFYQIRGKKSFKTRPNTPYGGETSRYSLLQGGVSGTSSGYDNSF